MNVECTCSCNDGERALNVGSVQYGGMKRVERESDSEDGEGQGKRAYNRKWGKKA